MKFIIAKKEGMTRIFAEDGRAYAGTILKADPVTITQVKTKDGKDAYSAVQVGHGGSPSQEHQQVGAWSHQG
jgi:large subunit ribosomal protein L3